MCGICAILFYNEEHTMGNILHVSLLEMLEKLEKMGSHSVGIAVDNSVELDEIKIIKTIGKVETLREMVEKNFPNCDKLKFNFHVAFGQTRWATHGDISEINAQPQSSGPGNKFVVVHNGIIYNAENLKKFLKLEGHHFQTETDTEVIAVLLRYLFKRNETLSFNTYVEQACRLLDGTFALCVKSTYFPGEMVAAIRGSPLIIGIKGDFHSNVKPTDLKDFEELSTKGESEVPASALTSTSYNTRQFFQPREEKIVTVTPVKQNIKFIVASHPNVILPSTKDAIFLEDNDIAYFDNKGNLTVTKVDKDAQTSPKPRQKNQLSIREIIALVQNIVKGGYDLKREIFEQPEAVVNAMRGRIDFDTGNVKLGGIESLLKTMDQSRQFVFVSKENSTSGYAVTTVGAVLDRFLSKSGMYMSPETSPDFHLNKCKLDRRDTVFFISQSGENEDILDSVQYAKQRHCLVVGINNSPGSPLTQNTDCGIHLNVGRVLGRASTKVFLAKCVDLILVAIVLSRKSIQAAALAKDIVQSLKTFPDLINETLNKLDDQMKGVAEMWRKETNILLMGRGQSFGIVKEGALKISYITGVHAEGIDLAELKHGTLAMVDKDAILIVIITKEESSVDKNVDFYPKCMSNLNQIVTRHGKPLVIGEEDDEELRALCKEKTCRFVGLPKTHYMLQPLLAVIPLQLLSYHLAMYKRLDANEE